MNAVRETVEGVAQAGVRHLTLYAFSDANWARPANEVRALMTLMEEYVALEKKKLAENGVRLTVFGDLSRLSKSALRAVRDVENATALGDSLEVHVAISYGSRDEIVRAARALAKRCAEGELFPEEIDEKSFADALRTREWPDPDLLIRTSGEQRISNFLLWQLAYAEIFVTDVLWPDFTREDLFKALIDYSRRDRRFGLVKT